MATNPFPGGLGDGLPATLMYPNSSLAEALQQALPGISPTVFLSGNDESAKALVQDLLGELGWAPDRIEDLGDIRTARGPELGEAGASSDRLVLAWRGSWDAASTWAGQRHSLRRRHLAKRHQAGAGHGMI